MKTKLITLIALIFLFASCNLGKCDLKGCDNDGRGWVNTGPECPASISPCHVKKDGGYCSREHASQGKYK